MSFKELELEIGYDSDEIDILEKFYKPVLKNSVLYQRLAGYFSSTTFGLAIREMLEFIEKGGKIKLVTSVELSKQDKKVIEDYVNGKTEEFEKILLEKIDESTNIFKDCASLFGWMLANKIDNEPQLEMKIAIPETPEGEIDTSSIYHQKVGIFTDNENNKISFEGSVNETGKAWQYNIEKFKVSTSWTDKSDKKRVELDQKAFEKFWTDSAKRTRIIELPIAVKEKFLRIRPKSTKEFEELVSRIKNEFNNNDKKISLRDYQKEAIDNWVNNDYRGIFEMATGSGKTFAAMGCINKILKKEKRLAVIIACPYTHLVEQWSTVFQVFNEKIEESWRVDGFVSESCYADYPNWKLRLKRRIRDINEKDVSGKYFLEKLVIFTTHDTLSSENFTDLIKQIQCPILLIVDEVHAVGAELRLQNLLESYHYRLGLSATPTRYFDDEGTIRLKNYFGGVVGEFPISRAIKEKFLSPYKYIPNIVDLNDDEMERYRELTKKLAKKLSMIGDPKKQENEISSFIEGERASIIAAAEKKYDAFKTILEKIGDLDHCLIYCHEKQLERVKHILFDKGIVYHQITYREPTEMRIKILNQLAIGSYHAVVAINCLDEGVDIPSAKIGIILASTGNPRQYIQRRGRLLRKEKGKDEAIIYDILVVPYADNSSDILPLEKKIVQKELERYSDFAESSNNKEEAEKIISGVRQTYGL